jgi:cob(I)alamin adenosyltransferase
VRRAERCVWTLAAKEQVNVEVPKYLNRLSDLLFVLARVLARQEKGSEVLWRHDRGSSAAAQCVGEKNPPSIPAARTS